MHNKFYFDPQTEQMKKRLIKIQPDEDIDPNDVRRPPHLREGVEAVGQGHPTHSSESRVQTDSQIHSPKGLILQGGGYDVDGNHEEEALLHEVLSDNLIINDQDEQIKTVFQEV